MKNKFFKSIFPLIFIAIMMFSFTCKKKGNDSESQKESIKTSESEHSSEEHSSENEYYGEEKYVIKDGDAKYAIVISETATIAIINAAMELTNYVEQSTGVGMKTYRDSEEIPSKYKVISLGKTKQLKKADFSWDYELNGDGFYMWTKNDDLFIDSNYDRGVMYGVYEFLERFLGIKFLAFDYYHIPKNTEVVIYDMQITEIPTFRERDMFCAVDDQDTLSKLRYLDEYGFGANSKYGEGYYYENSANGGHSSMSVYLPKDRYYAEHPEWYSDSGAQVNPVSGLDENDNYTGDPNSGIYTTIQNVKTEIINNPTRKYFFIGQEDNSNYQCADVKASMARNGDSVTAVWMIYINTIAREIKAWADEVFPGREIKIGTFAYQWTIVPPVKEVVGADGKKTYVPINEKVVPPDNVFIKFAPLNACWYHDYKDDSCPTNKMYATYLKGWASICDSFQSWDYQTNYYNYLFWFPHYNSMKKNYETYQEYGFWRVLQQHSTGESSYYQNILDAYVGSKLMWDINLNTADLIKEFNYYYFGEEICGYVDKYVDLMETHFATLNVDDTVCQGTYDSIGSGACNASLYPIELLERGLKLIEDAIEKVKTLNITDEEKEALTIRLERVAVHPTYMILANFESYYDSELKYDFAKKFVKYGDDIGLRRVEEFHTYSEYKKTLGF